MCWSHGCRDLNLGDSIKVLIVLLLPHVVCKNWTRRYRSKRREYFKLELDENALAVGSGGQCCYAFNRGQKVLHILRMEMKAFQSLKKAARICNRQLEVVLQRLHMARYRWTSSRVFLTLMISFIYLNVGLYLRQNPNALCHVEWWQLVSKSLESNHFFGFLAVTLALCVCSGAPYRSARSDFLGYSTQVLSVV